MGLLSKPKISFPIRVLIFDLHQVIMHLPDLKWRKIFGNLWKVETCSASVTWGIGYDYLPSVFMLNSVRRFKKKGGYVVPMYLPT